MSKRANLGRALKRRRPDAPDPVERVAVLTRTARTTWLGLLSYLAFVGVTLMGVEDADFFLSERQTDLPLIGVSVPTNLFFYIAPTLGAMLYIHMHLYLLKLWKALGELPSEPNRPAGEGIAPWIVSDMALSAREGAVHDYPLRVFARWVAILSIFVAGPAVLAAFWWRSMPKHDEVLTILFCGLPLFFSIPAGWESWRSLRRGGTEARYMPRRTWAGWAVGAILLSAVGFLTTEGTFAAYARTDRVNLIVTEWEFTSLYERRKTSLIAELEDLAAQDNLSAFEARLDQITDYPDPDDLDHLADRLLERRWWMRTWMPGWLRPAQLQNVVFVETPTNWLPRDEAEQAFRPEWCAAKGIEPLACGPGPLARDEEGDKQLAPDYLPYQRLLWCQEVMGEDTPEATCTTYFTNLNDRYRADWRKARRDAIDRLPGRNLSGTDLRQANLFGARMEGTNLIGARMERAILRHARLEGALLYNAQMQWTDLTQARMETAYLSDALMEGAYFAQTRMEGAYFDETRMERAYLFRTQMDNTVLTAAATEDTAQVRLQGAALKGIRSTLNITAEQVNSVFGDASVILPEGMDSPANWPKWKLPWSGDHAFEDEWRKWQANPERYTPPERPPLELR